MKSNDIHVGHLRCRWSIDVSWTVDSSKGRMEMKNSLSLAKVTRHIDLCRMDRL